MVKVALGEVLPEVLRISTVNCYPTSASFSSLSYPGTVQQSISEYIAKGHSLAHPKILKKSTVTESTIPFDPR